MDWRSSRSSQRPGKPVTWRRGAVREACAVLALDVRMLQRWKKELQEENKLEDQRKVAAAERDTPFAMPEPIPNNFLPVEASKFTKRGR